MTTLRAEVMVRLPVGQLRDAVVRDLFDAADRESFLLSPDRRSNPGSRPA